MFKGKEVRGSESTIYSPFAHCKPFTSWDQVSGAIEDLKILRALDEEDTTGGETYCI